MRLENLHIAGENHSVSISLQNGRVQSIGRYEADEAGTGNSILFDDAIVFPGLINSHDHLDFNCFPLLINRKYRNYREWGREIHVHNKNEIEQVLRIPQSLRIMWGLYKNLLNGFTTVVHHGSRIPIPENTITVVQESVSLHSIAFERNWRWKLNKNYEPGSSIAMHIGEGVDEIAAREIDSVPLWNLRNRKITAIHGIGMKPSQARGFQSFVWCPASNYSMFNSTARVDVLKDEIPILFGTDSTLTASWNSWDQLRLAKATGMLSSTSLYDMLTTKMENSWQAEEYGLEKNQLANFVVARKKRKQFDDSFFEVNPEDILLVIHGGRILVCDQKFLELIPASDNFSTISFGTQKKYVYGDLPGLTASIKSFYPQLEIPFHYETISSGPSYCNR